jgi:hypothetical protein
MTDHHNIRPTPYRMRKAYSLYGLNRLYKKLRAEQIDRELESLRNIDMMNFRASDIKHLKR